MVGEQGTGSARKNTTASYDSNHLETADARRGQGLVEFALAAPVLFILLLVAVQLALVVTQYYSLMSVTGDTARWLAIRPDSNDGEVIAHARANGMTLDPNRYLSIVTSPSCLARDPGTGHCELRRAGDLVSVTIAYDISTLLFLPRDYGFGAMRVQIPQTLPTYRVTVMIE